jgi:hypothetical protein
MPPITRASAATEEVRREASPSSSLNFSAQTTNRSEKFAADVQPQADNFFPANTSTTNSSSAGVFSAADTPPWEEATPQGDDGYRTASPPLKLVPPPAPESDSKSMTPAAAPAAIAPAAKMSGNGGSIVERIKTGLEDRRKPLLAIALEGARKVSLEDEDVYVEFAPETKHLRDNLSKPESVKLLREVCESVCGRPMGVRIVVREKGESDDEATTATGARNADAEEKRRLRELAENHPAVQQVLRTFHAQIVDVSRE